MAARLLFTSAGNGSSNNLVRSMRAGAGSSFIVGCNDDQFALKKSDADRNYLVPPADHPEWSEVLRWIMKTERLHLIIPTVDSDVESLSRARKTLGEYLFLPSESVLRCLPRQVPSRLRCCAATASTLPKPIRCGT